MPIPRKPSETAMIQQNRRGMGELEHAVLRILWDGDDWMTPGAVLEVIDLDPPVVYSTVMTILRRLWKKGVVQRQRNGKAYEYRPVLNESEQTAGRMADLLNAADNPDAALTQFMAGLDRKRRRTIRSLLEDC